VRLIDVREPEEFALARSRGGGASAAQPLSEWAGALEAEDEIVVMCHHGIRSAQVCAYLANQGFTRMSNLAGGIERWSQEVDRSVPRY
jgi:rhodanese-related sulfurtransferase